MKHIYWILFSLLLIISCSKGYRYNENTDEGIIERDFCNWHNEGKLEIISIERIDSVCKIEATETIEEYVSKINLLKDKIDVKIFYGLVPDDTRNALDSWEYTAKRINEETETIYKILLSNDSVIYSHIEFNGKIEYDVSNYITEWNKNDFIKKNEPIFNALIDTLQKLSVQDPKILESKRKIEYERREALGMKKQKEEELKRKEYLDSIKTDPEYSKGYNWGNRDGKSDRECHNEERTSFDYNSIVKAGYTIGNREIFCEGYEEGYEDGWNGRYKHPW